MYNSREVSSMADNYRWLNNSTQIRPATSKTMIFIDYENVHILLEQSGYQTDPEKVIHAIKILTADLGHVVAIEAFADWKELERHSQMDIRRRLEHLNIRTYGLVSHHGKNSADMRIVNRIRDVIEPVRGKTTIKKILLVSGDRDFRDVIYAIKAHKREAVVLGFKSNMSHALAHCANEVRFLDDALNTPIYNPVQYNSPYPANVEQIKYLIEWVIARIARALQKMPYVDSNYLAIGMAQDQTLRNWGIAQTKAEAYGWLAFLASEGLIVHVDMPHPKTPQRIINTWLLPICKKQVYSIRMKLPLDGFSNTYPWA
jgi:uncharacterized LabA/DUF88 family protein